MKEHKTFKSFDKVLARRPSVSGNLTPWKADIFSHIDEEGFYITIGLGHITEDNILPYEGNEELVGTTDEPEEEVRLEEGEIIICSDYLYRLSTGTGILEHYKGNKWNRFHTHDSVYEYAIRFKDFDPSNMEETKKHILCVKNGKIVKYKE